MLARFVNNIICDNNISWLIAFTAPTLAYITQMPISGLRIRTSDEIPEGDKVVPVCVPRLYLIQDGFGEAEIATIHVVSIRPADVHVVGDTVLPQHLLRLTVRAQEPVVDIHAEPLLRVPGILQEVPAVGDQIGHGDLPALVPGRERIVQVIVFIVNSNPVAVGVVIGVLVELLEVRPHRPCCAVVTLGQVAETRLRVPTQVKVLAVAVQLDGFVPLSWHNLRTPVSGDVE